MKLKQAVAAALLVPVLAHSDTLGGIVNIPSISVSGGLGDIWKSASPNDFKMVNDWAAKTMTSLGTTALKNIMQQAGGVIPAGTLDFCYDYSPSLSNGTISSSICDLFKVSLDPCKVAPDLSAFGYRKKSNTALLKKETDEIAAYCSRVLNNTASKVSFSTMVKDFKATNALNIEKGVPATDTTGVLSWGNIKEYNANGKQVTNNFYLYKAVAENDTLAVQYYRDVLENSSGYNSVSAFGENDIKTATVSYKTLKDYDDDVSKLAGMIKASSYETTASRMMPYMTSEMSMAETNAGSNKDAAEKNKEDIAQKVLAKIEKTIDQDVKFKRKLINDITMNPNNRIAYPVQGYVSALPTNTPGQKVAKIRTIARINLQAKRDAWLEANLKEIGELKKENAKIVAEAAKISARQFDANAAVAEINALIQ